MNGTDSSRGGAGQRTLAAVVFTDAVNFSARMTEDEPAALKMVRQDLETMSVICRQFDGQVIKNTGDGLMMLFSSAVQAVHCAIEIQRRFVEAARLQPEAASFEHRIGVHLGDVVLTAGDAFGDGVNVAARLQEHAAPGGICMSQTVYEVVRSSLAVPVERPQRLELKNVETVQALRIGPEALTGHVAPRRRPRSGGGRGYAWIAGGIVVLAAAIAYVGWSVSEGLKRVSVEQQAAPGAGPAATTDSGPVPRGAAGPAATPSESPAGVPSSPATPGPASREPSAPAAGVAPVPASPDARRSASGTPGTTGAASSKSAALTGTAVSILEELEKRRLEAHTTYAYRPFLSWLTEHERSLPPDRAALMLQRYRLLDEAMTWLTTQMAATTEANPFELRADPASGLREAKAWSAGDRLVFSGPAGTQTVEWRGVPPRGVARLFEAATRANPPQRQEGQRRRMWMMAFAREYGLALPPGPRAPR